MQRMKGKVKRILSGMLLVMTIMTSIIQPITIYAAETEPAAYEAEYPALEKVKDNLAEEEMVQVQDYEVEVGSSFDVKTDFSGMKINTTYGFDAAWVVLDEDGKLVVDNVYNSFDEAFQKQIKEYLNPVQNITEPQKQEKPPLENWQKSYENGEYLRSAEITEEQNYNMIDGRMNNLPSKPRKIGQRISVLDRLHLKQAEIAKRSGKPVPQMNMAENMERRRN